MRATFEEIAGGGSEITASMLQSYVNRIGMSMSGNGISPKLAASQICRGGSFTLAPWVALSIFGSNYFCRGKGGRGSSRFERIGDTIRAQVPWGSIVTRPWVTPFWGSMGQHSGYNKSSSARAKWVQRPEQVTFAEVYYVIMTSRGCE